MTAAASAGPNWVGASGTLASGTLASGTEASGTEASGTEAIETTFGLGSNLGDRLAHLQAAVDVIASCAVRDGAPALRISAVYETAPVGPAQPDYLNAVVVAALPPDVDPLELALRAEAERGRVRDVRWGPRTLDVDVLDIAGRTIERPGLTVPHPHAAERAFVLVPWADVAPDATVPRRDGSAGATVRELLAGLDGGGVRHRADLVLRTPP